MARKKEVLTLSGMIAVGCLSLLPRQEAHFRQARGYPQLTSIQELPESEDKCLLESAPEMTAIAYGHEQSLFSEFEEIPAHAATSEPGTDVTRPPTRQVWDTAPIYSAIAVDPERS